MNTGERERAKGKGGRDRQTDRYMHRQTDRTKERKKQTNKQRSEGITTATTTTMIMIIKSW